MSRKPRRSTIKRIAFLFCLSVSLQSFVVSPLAFAQNADKTKGIKAQKERLREVRSREGSILEALEAMDKAIVEAEEKLDDVRSRQKAVETRIAALESEREMLETGLARRRLYLQKRLRALYKYSSKGFLQVLLSGGSGTDVLKRTRYLQRIVRRDMQLLQEQREALKRFRSIQEELEVERARVGLLFEEVEAQVTALQAERERKSALLAQVRQEKSSARRRLLELESAAKALNARISSLPTTQKRIDNRREGPVDRPSFRPKAPQQKENKHGFSAYRGRMPFPVVGGKIVRAFGRFKEPGMKIWEFSRGLDIRAPSGTPFKVLFDGEVKLAEWFKGYGLLLIVDHGGGFHTIYAHASRLYKKKGQKVAKGEVVGLVGDTGSFRGPFLYLEVRRRGKAINPLEWIEVPPDALAIPGGG